MKPIEVFFKLNGEVLGNTLLYILPNKNDGIVLNYKPFLISSIVHMVNTSFTNNHFCDIHLEKLQNNT